MCVQVLAVIHYVWHIFIGTWHYFVYSWVVLLSSGQTKPEESYLQRYISNYTWCKLVFISYKDFGISFDKPVLTRSAVNRFRCFYVNANHKYFHFKIKYISTLNLMLCSWNSYSNYFIQHLLMSYYKYVLLFPWKALLETLNYTSLLWYKMLCAQFYCSAAQVGCALGVTLHPFPV